MSGSVERDDSCSVAVYCDAVSREPVCEPLRSTEEVKAWQPRHDDLCVARIPKAKRNQLQGPRTLVCHDMKGGYLDDRFVQGGEDPRFYRFYHWQYVDTFVYFSHHFVTIPPPSWTNAAHKHGTLMLGTLITEWDDGKKNCEAVLQSETSYKAFADKLVQITQYYGFDGWLVNIENIIETPLLVDQLRDFVAYLTCRQHEKVAGSQVIWYDSVINTGELKWQNKLNDLNNLFFDVSDGIFLNYCWSSSDLLESRTNAVAKGRPFDVYVGVDIFGRGCLGGGGYNTSEALTAVRQHDLSVAIFGQGWVFETQGAENFTQNENKFWHLIHHLCQSCSLSSLPLATSFCQGFGSKFFINGKVVSDKPWHNQNLMQLQPAYTNAQFFTSEAVPATPPLMELSTDDAFLGGACLCLAVEPQQNQNTSVKLFDLAVDLGDLSSLTVSCTYKFPSGEDCEVYLDLETDSGADSGSVLILGGAGLADTLVPLRRRRKRRRSSPDTVPVISLVTEISRDQSVSSSSTSLNNTQEDCSTGWNTRYFTVPAQYMTGVLRRLSVGLYFGADASCSTDGEFTEVLIGQIQLLPGGMKDQNPEIKFRSVEMDLFTPPTPATAQTEADSDATLAEMEETEAGKIDNESETLNQADNQGDCLSESAPGETTEGQESESAVKDGEVETNGNTEMEVQHEASDVTKEGGQADQSPAAPGQTGPTDHAVAMQDRLEKVRARYLKKRLTSNTPKTLKLQSTVRNNFTVHWFSSNPSAVQYYNIYVAELNREPVLLGHSVHSSFKVCCAGLVQGNKELETSETSQQPREVTALAASGNTGSKSEFACQTQVIIQPVLVTGVVIPMEKCATFHLSVTATGSIQ